MFETVAPELAAQPDRRAFYEALPLSLAIHSAVAAAVAISFLARVDFPEQPPPLMVPYLLMARAAAVPPPPPPLRAPARAGGAAPPPPTRAASTEIGAPTLIPDTIPDVAAPDPPTPAISTAQPANGTTTGSGDGTGEGIAGEPGGVAGGVAGGVKGGVLGGVLMNDGRVHFDRSLILPMMSLRYEYPIYPELPRLNREEGDVIIRYVIGADGAVKSAVVLEPSLQKDFDEAALRAIRRWRFRPLAYNGQNREVVHEVLVSFRLE